MRGQHIEDHSRSLVFVFQVGGVNQNLLVVFQRQLDMFLENDRLVSRVLVQSDFANSQHVGAIQKIGNQIEDFTRELDVVGFLGIDAQPCVMPDSILGSTFRFGFGQLPKIVPKTFRRCLDQNQPKTPVR